VEPVKGKGSSTVCSGAGARIGNVEPKSYVLDTSALLALVENEDGAGHVESILQDTPDPFGLMAKRPQPLLEEHRRRRPGSRADSRASRASR
jgi:hypothetical protein